jgi:ABC-type Na+ efflux pump permease subunit
MVVILGLLTVVSFFMGLEYYASAQTIMQEIMGGILLIIAAILFSGVAIVESVNRLRKSLQVPAKPPTVS